jgi:hypothetical protein
MGLYYMDDDSDPRNATATVTASPGRGGSFRRLRPVVMAQPSAQPSTVYAQPPQYGPGYRLPVGGGPQGPFAPGGQWGQPNPQSTPWNWGSPAAAMGMGVVGTSLLNGLGSLIEVGTQVLAAAQTLPTAPAKDETTDAGNLAEYQSALATFAQRDERLRTGGRVAGKLVDLAVRMFTAPRFYY